MVRNIEILQETENTSIPNKSRYLLPLLVIINLIRSTGGTSVSIGLPEFITSLEGSASTYGFVIGLFTITSTIFETPMAILSDKIGRKRSILICMIIYLVGTILCGKATSINQLLIFRAIQGAGAYSAILLSIISDKFTEQQRARAISFYMISLTGGYLFGNILGGLLVEFMNIRGIFYFNAILIAIAILMVFIGLPETNPNQELIGKKKTSYDWTFMWKLEYLFGILLNIVRSFSLSGILTYQVWLFTQDFYLSEFHTALVLIPMALIYIIGTLLAPKISEKLGILRLLHYSSILFVIFGGFILIKLELWWYVSFSLLTAFTMGVLEPEITSFTQNYIPDNERGLGNGIFNTIGFLFSALGQIILPTLSEKGDFQLAYGFLGIIWIMMSILLIFVRNKYE